MAGNFAAPNPKTKAMLMPGGGDGGGGGGGGLKYVLRCALGVISTDVTWRNARRLTLLDNHR